MLALFHSIGHRLAVPGPGLGPSEERLSWVAGRPVCSSALVSHVERALNVGQECHGPPHRIGHSRGLSAYFLNTLGTQFPWFCFSNFGIVLSLYANLI